MIGGDTFVEVVTSPIFDEPVAALRVSANDHRLALQPHVKEIVRNDYPGLSDDAAFTAFVAEAVALRLTARGQTRFDRVTAQLRQAVEGLAVESENPDHASACAFWQRVFDASKDADLRLAARITGEPEAKLAGLALRLGLPLAMERVGGPKRYTLVLRVDRTKNVAKATDDEEPRYDRLTKSAFVRISGIPRDTHEVEALSKYRATHHVVDKQTSRFDLHWLELGQSMVIEHYRTHLDESNTAHNLLKKSQKASIKREGGCR